MQHTTDPEAFDNPIQEGSGAVASDSLAAESVNSGGAFGVNRDSEPLSVSGSNSTFNNTDTSGTTTFAPAPDAAEREAKAAWQETADEAKGPGGQKYPEGLGGQGTFDGSHNADGYSGGPTGAKEGLSGDDNVYQASGIRGGGTDDRTGEDPTGNQSSSSAGTAPSYVSCVQSYPAQTGKPKGKNITEGGFDDDPSNNASFTSEIGSENDPGRAAEQKFQNTTQGATGNTGPNQKLGDSGDSQYDVLKSDQSL